MKTTSNVILLSAAAIGGAQAVCQKFRDIYPTGKELGEKMWDGAFLYEEDEEHAYDMWFFDANNNPNDEITRKLAARGDFELEGGSVDKCYLEYYHKYGDTHPINNNAHPSEEPETFQECHPWSENSCCFQETVETVQKLKEGYGAEYHWDRCGPLSQACERFFVMEACFYECSPHAGVFRKFKASLDDPDPFNGTFPLYDPDNEDTSTWQMHQMPIKASFFDAWWTACADDKFCSAEGGSFFSCAEVYKPFVDLEEGGSCENRCGARHEDGLCGCDVDCELNSRCCADRADFCKVQYIKGGSSSAVTASVGAAAVLALAATVAL